jgi:hypothetical protein
MIGKDRLSQESLVPHPHDTAPGPRRHPLPYEGPRKVVTLGCTGAFSHEESTHIVLSKEIARVLRVDYGGRLEDLAGAEPVYCIPRDTLNGQASPPDLEQMTRDESQFLGGWVPYPILATKGIVHPLAPREAAPDHWPAEFAARVQDLVLPGFTAFSVEGAMAAGRMLLRHGSVRIKPLQARGGQGQRVATESAALASALQGMDMAGGLVLERNLSDVRTFTVGRVRLGGMDVSYTGYQELTPDNFGALAYGGSTLSLVRGGFIDLLTGLAPQDEHVARLAVDFDHLASLLLGLRASRRNYDVIAGRDETGQFTPAVLEQSWRVGGATGAELAAVAAFRANPALRRVTASTVERYGGDVEPPPGATVYFRGVDPVVGPLLKYAIIREVE